MEGKQTLLSGTVNLFVGFILSFFRVKDNNLLSSQTEQTPTVSWATCTNCSTNPLSDIASIDSWSLIDEDLKLIPEFTIKNVLQYFIYRKECDGLERQDWKNFKSGGYNLYKEGHVQKVYASISTNVVYVKAICLPEMKKDRTYPLVLTLDKMTADVTNAKCSCPAGQGPSGSCKHLAALCYALEDYVKLRAIMEAGENSCTSLLQKWNQPRKRRLDSLFSCQPHC